VTFRGRLRFFFAIIVIVPIVGLGGVLLTQTRASEEGKTDARLATALDVATAAYSDGRRAAADALERIVADPQLAAALRGGDRSAAASRLRRLALVDSALVSATLSLESGEVVARSGSSFGVASAAGEVRRPDGGRVGTLTVSVTDARVLVRSVASSTSLGVLVIRDGRLVATSVPGVRSAPEQAGQFGAGGEEYRGRRVPVGRAPEALEEIGVFRDASEANEAIRSDRLLIVAALVAFLALALVGAVVLLRALQGEIGGFLRAARSLSAGRFDQPVTVRGDDDFAQLGREFNRMSENLEGQIREVQLKQHELEETIRRVGEAFASGLDSQAAFELTVQTAVDACHAEAGRGAALDTSLLRSSEVGHRSPALTAAMDEAVRRASEPGDHNAATAVSTAGGHALGVALLVGADRGPGALAGVVAIARSGQPFTREETEMLAYLVARVTISIDNALLHGRVQEDAMTDELTRLSNLRQMRAGLARELERGRRFNTSVGLVALDIDDFKRVNDTFGHPQGDEVLRQVAGVLHDLSREIDEPARSGGEEMAVVVSQTSLEGAAHLAERMREGIEGLQIPRLDGEGEIRVTASFGVAAVPGSAHDEASLIAAADAALYRAKRAGKNRVELAAVDAAL